MEYNAENREEKYQAGYGLTIVRTVDAVVCSAQRHRERHIEAVY